MQPAQGPSPPAAADTALAPAQGPTTKVATWNIGGKDRRKDDRFATDLGQSLRKLADGDVSIICLQEVGAHLLTSIRAALEIDGDLWHIEHMDHMDLATAVTIWPSVSPASRKEMPGRRIPWFARSLSGALAAVSASRYKVRICLLGRVVTAQSCLPPKVQTTRRIALSPLASEC